ncbi:glycosyltransferase family 2 protein [Patescibacteria group bacterium]|nr:glycosyltransferase family 2 protein [Patescibacteria group bacterium]
MNSFKTLTIVIPALNEEKGIGPVLKDIPLKKLERIGYKTEILVIDNNSTDNTGKIAREHGANVIVMPIRGYGNAYKAGFANASGDIIATGDADLTYPFDILPEILLKMEREDLDFINTDRLTNLNKEVMSWSHQIGNTLLTFFTKILFGWPYIDSQSGMWIFKRSIWKSLTVKSSGMPFSQELKIEAFSCGFKCAEIPINYQARAGKEKLNTISDGLGNITHLIRKKLSLSKRQIHQNVLLLVGGIVRTKKI